VTVLERALALLVYGLVILLLSVVLLAILDRL
jgi:hypothetical protein